MATGYDDAGNIALQIAGPTQAPMVGAAGAAPMAGVMSAAPVMSLFSTLASVAGPVAAMLAIAKLAGGHLPRGKGTATDAQIAQGQSSGEIGILEKNKASLESQLASGTWKDGYADGPLLNTYDANTPPLHSRQGIQEEIDKISKNIIQLKEAYNQQYPVQTQTVSPESPVSQSFTPSSSQAPLNQQSYQDIMANAQPATPSATSPTVTGLQNSGNPVAGTSTTTVPTSTTPATTSTSAPGTQAPTQNQDIWSQIMNMFGGSQGLQGMAQGAMGNAGVNPLLSGVAGAGIGQIGNALGNMTGTSNGGNLPGQNPGQGSTTSTSNTTGSNNLSNYTFNNGNSLGGGSAFDFFNGQQPPNNQPPGSQTGVSTGGGSASNPPQQDVISQLMSMFGIQNPGQAGVGAGLLGLGQVLDKDIKLPEFWDDRGVKALDAWNQTANHPLDPNVDASIQRTLDIQNEQRLRNLRDVYKNARPGGDYLNDSAYQRDLENLNRSMATQGADAKAGAQLQSNAQNIGIMSNLAEGSVGQGWGQAALDSVKQGQQNKLFGDLGSAFLTGSLQKPATNNTQQIVMPNASPMANFTPPKFGA